MNILLYFLYYVRRHHNNSNIMEEAVLIFPIKDGWVSTLYTFL